MPRTMFDKIWRSHEVADGLIYIDLHLVHEVTSPQAFDGLRIEGRTVRRPDKTVATADHNVPTDGTPAARLIADELSRVQVETLERNCEEFGIPLYSLGSDRQGIVHVIGPELGLTQPGLTIVCGDSHTSTHGAFGALAFGIGTSEVEHVLATQCLVQRRPKTMRISYAGELGHGVGAKDLILATIGRLGTGGMAGHAVEYAGADDRRALDGEPDDDLQHDDRGRRPRRDDRARRDDVRVDRRSSRGPRRPRGGGRRMAPAADRGGCGLRHRDRGRRRLAVADGHLGNEPGPGRRGHRRGPGAAVRARAARASLHGSRARARDPRDPARSRLHRLVHELEDRRPAGGGVDGRGPQGGEYAERDGRPRLRPGQGRGRGRGPRRGLPSRRVRLAQRRLLDVPGDEPRHPQPGRAVRLDVESQLRGTPGQGRPDAPGLAPDGRRGGDRGQVRRHPGRRRWSR